MSNLKLQSGRVTSNIAGIIDDLILIFLVRNFGTMMVPYVEILNRALSKYGSNCDLYEILLYVQRFIENEKIPIGRSFK